MRDAAHRRELAAALAAAFLAGAWTEDAMLRRAAEVLEPRPRWLRSVVRDARAAYHRPPADRPRELAAYVALVLERGDPAAALPRVRRWRRLRAGHGPDAAGRSRRSPRRASSPSGSSSTPASSTWLADPRGLERGVADRRLRHYRYVWLPRAGAPPRPIARPKRRLKEIQRWILHAILDRIPAHDAAHGFARGRSARSHATRHAGRATVVRIDLEDFFASVPAARVYGIFRTAGYPGGGRPRAHRPLRQRRPARRVGGRSHARTTRA